MSITGFSATFQSFVFVTGFKRADSQKGFEHLIAISHRSSQPRVWRGWEMLSSLIYGHVCNAHGGRGPRERVSAKALCRRVIFTLCWSGSLTVTTQSSSIQSASFSNTVLSPVLTNSEPATPCPNFATFPRHHRARCRKSRARVKGFILRGLLNLYCHKSLISATHMRLLFQCSCLQPDGHKLHYSN